MQLPGPLSSPRHPALVIGISQFGDAHQRLKSGLFTAVLHPV